MRTSTITALAAAALLAAAAPAQADSIAYVKAGDVWLATPDGSRQVQITHRGGYSSVSQADNGTLVALAPKERLHTLSRRGEVLADIATYVSDGAPKSGPINSFGGPFDPQISPDGKLIAYEWFNTSYGNGSTPDCQVSAGCYTSSSRKGVGITRSDRFTGPGEYGLLTGWSSPEWLGNDTLLRSFSQANLAEDAVFNKIGPGKGDDELDRWFFDPNTGGTLSDVELSRDRKAIATIAGQGYDHMLLYRPLREPLGAPDWNFSPWAQNNEPVVEQCWHFAEPEGGRFKAVSIAPDSRRFAYEVGNGIWVAQVPDMTTDCGAKPAFNALRIPGGSSPDWGPADVPATGSIPSTAPTVALGGKVTLRRALTRGLAVRTTGLPDGTAVTATRKGKVVATGKLRGSRATLRFTRAAKAKLKRARTASLTLAAGSARTKVTLRR